MKNKTEIPKTFIWKCFGGTLEGAKSLPEIRKKYKNPKIFLWKSTGGTLK